MYIKGHAVLKVTPPIFTFCAGHRRRKMYSGHTRLCVCLSVAVCPHYCTHPVIM